MLTPIRVVMPGDRWASSNHRHRINRIAGSSPAMTTKEFSLPFHLSPQGGGMTTYPRRSQTPFPSPPHPPEGRFARGVGQAG